MNREARARLFSFAAALMQPLQFPDDPQEIGSAPSIAPHRDLDAFQNFKPLPMPTGAAYFNSAEFKRFARTAAEFERARIAFKGMPRYALPQISAAQLLILMQHPFKRKGP